jgi:hypothetical protein
MSNVNTSFWKGKEDYIVTISAWCWGNIHIAGVLQKVFYSLRIMVNAHRGIFENGKTGPTSHSGKRLLVVTQHTTHCS